MKKKVEFKRTIGLFMAVMIGIGAMMGPGIFALPGEVAGMVGPLGILVYFVMGALTLFTALNYSELGASIPIAGGGYSFVSRTLPRPVAFFTGWFFWIGNTLACAMYGVIFALTVQTYFFPEVNFAVIILLITIVFAAVNLRGMSEAIKLVTIMNIIELAVLLGFVILGIFHVQAMNLKPIAPMGWAQFFPAMSLIYLSYVGFELITVASEEIKNPGKTIPRAIIITMIVGVIIYVLVVWVMMGTVNYKDLSKSKIPFIFASDSLFGAWGRWAAISATIMASLSAFAVTIGASARVLFALGRDRHFPYEFAKLHKRYQTPYIALLVTAIIVFLFSASGIVKFVASMSDFGYLMGLGVVNYSVIALQKKMPNLRRPFKVALFPLVPILGMLSCWLFVPALEMRSFVLGGVLTIIGLIVFLMRPANRKELVALFFVYQKKILTWFASLRRRRMRILIVGGGKHGQNIANRLLSKDEYHLLFKQSEYQLTFIEEDEARCMELEQRFNVPVFQGDGTKKQLLEQVGLDNIDVVIASSNDDGRNVIIALQAKQLGVNQVIAIVQDSDYIQLLSENGVVAISSPWATAAMVENFLERPGVVDLFEIGSGAAHLISVFVPEKAVVSGQNIRDIDIPDGCVVAAVIRGKKFVAPRGNTQILEGDQVVFVGLAKAVKKAQDIFQAI